MRTCAIPLAPARPSASARSRSQPSKSPPSPWTRASCVSTSALPASSGSRSSCSRKRCSVPSRSSKSQKRRSRSGIDRDMPRLGRDAAEPGAHGRIRLELEAALVRDVRVAVERDIRERIRVADEEEPPVQVPVERSQRPLPGVHPLGQPVGEFLRAAGVRDPEADDRHGWLEVVLLEEHPLQHLRPLVWILGHEARSVAEVPEDRARLAERATVVEHERRHPQRGVEPAEHIASVRTVDHVQGATLVRDPEESEEQANLVAVARDRVFVEDDQTSTIAAIASATSPARNGIPRTRLKPVASTRNSARISFCSCPRLISGTSTLS